jgi:hypothetical protein
MKHSFKSSAILSMGLLGIGGSAYATQPPDVVSSDSHHNTAMGTEALLNLTNGEANTASGYRALYLNTTGGSNSAFGFGALIENTVGNTSSILAK